MDSIGPWRAFWIASAKEAVFPGATEREPRKSRISWAGVNPSPATAHVDDTVADLLGRLASARRGAPPLLALGMLVQLLKRLDTLHGRGEVHGAVHPGSLQLRGRSARELLDDSTRDPRLVLGAAATAPAAYLAPERRVGAPARPASDVWSAGTVLEALLTGGPPPVTRGRRSRYLGGHRELRALVEAMTAPHPADRPTAAAALNVARRLALERFADWDRERTLVRLAESLTAAVERMDRPRARDLLDEIEAQDPGSPRLAEGRNWLERCRRQEAEVRHRLAAAVYRRRAREAAWQARRLAYLLGEEADGDGDLALARRWLDEETVRSLAGRVVRRENRLKLVLTAAPLVAATLLALLLVAVLYFSAF